MSLWVGKLELICRVSRIGLLKYWPTVQWLESHVYRHLKIRRANTNIAYSFPRQRALTGKETWYTTSALSATVLCAVILFRLTASHFLARFTRRSFCEATTRSRDIRNCLLLWSQNRNCWVTEMAEQAAMKLYVFVFRGIWSDQQCDCILNRIYLDVTWSLISAGHRLKKMELRGLSPRAKYRPSNRQILRKEGATWSAWRIPTAVFSAYYTGATTFPFKQLFSCTQEADWTPFQTHYPP
jgi:hypothetical protein